MATANNKKIVVLAIISLLPFAACRGQKEAEEVNEEAVVAGTFSGSGQTTQTQSTTGSRPAVYTFESDDDFPTCEETLEGALVFDKSAGRLFICLSGAYMEVGAPGEDGTNGAPGAKGEAGEPGDDALALQPTVYDANGALIGTMLTFTGMAGSGDFILIASGSGGIAQFNYGTGSFSQSLGFSTATATPVGIFCGFESNDCTGACYAVDVNNSDIKPAKNAVFYNGSSFVIADGTEVDVGSKTYQSFLSATQTPECLAANATLNHGYLVATPFTMPAEVTYPLAMPLTYQLPQ